jgi:two-component system, cell cycle response regulator
LQARQHIHVLLISAEPKRLEEIRHLTDALPDYSCVIDIAGHTDAAVAKMHKIPYSVIFLDTEADKTLENYEQYRQRHGGTNGAPVIVIAHRDDEREAVECLKMGASDYVLRDTLTGELVNRAIRTALVRHALELERNRLMSELRELSITDPLTGVGNRRFFMDRLRQEMERCERSHRPFSLLMIDLDHFKNVNDTHGHQTGDTILRQCAEMLLRNTRRTDVVARYGGEEFCVILPETAEGQALMVAEKLRWVVEDESKRAQVPITISVGMTIWQKNDTLDDVMRRSDKAMYSAKELGRNKVVAFSGMAETKK